MTSLQCRLSFLRWDCARPVRVAAWLVLIGSFLTTGSTKIVADDVTAGPNGINSRGLGVTGNGVNIGQVELGRPGERLSIIPDAAGEWFWDYGADRIPGTADAGEGNGTRDFPEWFVDLDNNGAYTPGWVNAHPDVEPFDASVVAEFLLPPRSPVLKSAGPPAADMGTFVTQANYESNFATLADAQVDDHALQVAGVMIANGAANKGVATGARLYSGAFGVRGSSIDTIALTTQAVLRSSFDSLQPTLSDVRAVNHSWGTGPIAPNDGTNPRSLALDYFSSRYDSLQVVAGDELQDPISHPGAPSDAFNIINVSMLTDASGNGTGVYDRYDAGNRFAASLGNRDTVQLAAPGRNVFMPLLGGTGYASASGTSFAAPHVTATAALLHEYGNGKRISDPTHWDGSARVHQVMKAVILNSADKLKDDGTIVPTGNLLGMEKTIYTDAAGTKTWLDSPAYTNVFDPLDDNIGAGALNAKRALKQYAAGEFDSDLTSSGSIPVLGWDNAFSQGLNQKQNYYFNQPLMPNSFISITLSWDRVVSLVDGNSNGLYDAGDSFATAGAVQALADLDLFLYRKNPMTGLFTDLIDRSVSGVDSTEHIFYKLTAGGDYAITVKHSFGAAASTEYGLAWWAVAVPEPSTIMLAFVAMVLSSAMRRR
ncbi:MAG: S8 family serine peptidase [Pirellulales bacterium]